MKSLSCMALALIASRADAFVPQGSSRRSCRSADSSMPLQALWRHWIPETKVDFLEDTQGQTRISKEQLQNRETDASNLFLGSLLALLLVAAPSTSVLAVSGGGLDFAGTDITGQDFSNQNYKGKDFTQVIAKGTNFAKSK